MLTKLASSPPTVDVTLMALSRARSMPTACGRAAAAGGTVLIAPPRGDATASGNMLLTTRRKRPRGEADGAAGSLGAAEADESERPS